jgi:hypothetical protein
LSCTANDDIINFVYDKEIRYNHLQRNFNKNFKGKVYMSQHACYENVSMPFDVEFIDYTTKQNIEDWSIVILQNNTINHKESTDVFWALKKSAPNAIYVCWDYDNHHWAILSTLSAALADIYIPAHSENVCAITRFNNNSFGPIPCGTLQWSREFAKNNLKTITNTKRSNEPLGHHFEYKQFAYRNGLIQKVNAVYKDVALVPPQYHERTQESRLKEWTNHKVHWVMPVFNDLPLRLFDAVFTGGIPLIPKTLQGNKYIADFEEHCMFYTLTDIVNPKPITECAIAKFDSEGKKGILKRHEHMLKHHHIDTRFNQIFGHIEKEFNIKLFA